MVRPIFGYVVRGSGRSRDGGAPSVYMSGIHALPKRRASGRRRGLRHGLRNAWTNLPHGLRNSWIADSWIAHIGTQPALLADPEHQPSQYPPRVHLLGGGVAALLPYDGDRVHLPWRAMTTKRSSHQRLSSHLSPLALRHESSPEPVPSSRRQRCDSTLLARICAWLV